MAEVTEFRGVRHNLEKIRGMADVICPPYDIISPGEQATLYARDEHNMVRLEHAVEMPGDNEKNNKYIRSRDTFNKWLKDRVLVQDMVASYYVHEHSFEMGEAKKKRIGLFACVRLEPWENRVIFPHEFTISGVKAERLKLMQACATNFSPIFGLYEDRGGKVNQTIISRLKSNPDYSFAHNGESHRFWAVNEPEFVQRVSHFLAPKTIYIADGHHRYETALAYRDYRRQLNPHGSSNDAYNFAMLTLVSFSDPGIVVLPIHRLVRGISVETLKKFRKEMGTYFDVTEVPADTVSISGKVAGSIKLYGLEKGKILFLKLLPKIKLNDIMAEKRSDAYCKLDVSAVQHIIVEKLLGLPAGDTDNLAYTPSSESACSLVESGQFQFVILLNPLPATTIKTIADANDRMPRKSTFFYPKLPSGLVIFRLEGTI